MTKLNYTQEFANLDVYKNSLQVMTESITNGYDIEYLTIISLVSMVFGVLVITAKNPIYSILFLIGLFVSISLYLMLSGLYFMGLSYLLVYVGAISILFIFILMLINVRVSELLTEGKNSIPLAILTIVGLNFAVTPLLSYLNNLTDLTVNHIYSVYSNIVNYFSTLYSVIVNVKGTDVSNSTQVYVTGDLASLSSSNWDSSLAESNHITSIGNILYTNLFILLIITSLILLAAMVGTISITVRKEKATLFSGF